MEKDTLRGLVGMLIGVIVGGVIGFAAATEADARELQRGVAILQQQNAAIEKLTVENARCREKFSGVTVIYGPELYDMTAQLPHWAKLAVQAAGIHSGVGSVRVLVAFPDRPARALLTLPAKLEPVAPAGSAFQFAWFNHTGQVSPRLPVAAQTAALAAVPPNPQKTEHGLTYSGSAGIPSIVCPPVQ